MDNIEFKELGLEQIHVLESLWNDSKHYHVNVSKYFSNKICKLDFNARFSELIEKSSNGAMKIIIASDVSMKKIIAYCVATIDHHGIGEIDSIHIADNYRLSKIGSKLITDILSWMDESHVKMKKVNVVVGNENVLSFYEKFGFKPSLIELESDSPD